MDGDNNGKPYCLMNDLGVFYPPFSGSPPDGEAKIWMAMILVAKAVAKVDWGPPQPGWHDCHQNCHGVFLAISS